LKRLVIDTNYGGNPQNQAAEEDLAWTEGGCGGIMRGFWQSA
jgi:hypothetical protein